jgi:hypothetical protein
MFIDGSLYKGSFYFFLSQETHVSLLEIFLHKYLGTIHLHEALLMFTPCTTFTFTSFQHCFIVLWKRWLISCYFFILEYLFIYYLMWWLLIIPLYSDIIHWVIVIILYIVFMITNYNFFFTFFMLEDEYRLILKILIHQKYMYEISS